MPRIIRCLSARSVCAFVAATLLWSGVVSTAAAQFHIPKIPGVSKTTNKTSETKPSPGSTLEVVSKVSPDSVPPGGHGQIVLTGQNFKDNNGLSIGCKGGDFTPDSIKVESPTRLVAQVSVPAWVQEGPCAIVYGTYRDQGHEILHVSNSANMPVMINLMLLGEGDMQMQDIMMSMSKMGQAAVQSRGGKMDPGSLQLDGGTIKYVKGGTTSFSESTSSVKRVEPVQMYGQSMGMFRIVFNNGKIYNFISLASNAPAGTNPGNAIMAFLQKKLGK